MEASATRSLPPPAAPAFAGTDDELLHGRATATAGTTDELVEALLEIRQQAGVPVELVARSYFPLLEYGPQLELLEMLAEGVAPHV
jgi:hypothetical protein